MIGTLPSLCQRLLGRPLRMMALAVLTALVLVAGTTAASSAAWSDHEWVYGRSLGAAASVPAASLTQPCFYNAGIAGIGAYVGIYWAPPAGYTKANASLYLSTGGTGTPLAPVSSTTFDVAANTTGTTAEYTTSISMTLLSSLVGLGATKDLAIVMTVGTAPWASVPAKVKVAMGVILSLGATCTNLS
ncbi:hypothetical protein [Psychromicrobium xiongbiense]|uniref:hypothetical protein n=1 Tax=Psychromicrobium xiongbiense TaxID=3051184 RepID=UPI002556115C|nr:hypothetical protein [Psychromicrobium sp. YIM S02556]